MRPLIARRRTSRRMSCRPSGICTTSSRCASMSDSSLMVVQCSCQSRSELIDDRVKPGLATSVGCQIVCDTHICLRDCTRVRDIKIIITFLDFIDSDSPGMGRLGAFVPPFSFWSKPLQANRLGLVISLNANWQRMLVVPDFLCGFTLGEKE